MTGERQPLRPSRGDLQIERADPLIQDLHGYYQSDQEQDSASLERAWQCVRQHLTENQAGQPSAADLPWSASRAESPYERTQRTLADNPQLSSAGQQRTHRAGLLAAMLVTILLVGSLTLVLNLSRSVGNTGSPVMATRTGTPPPIGTILYTLPGIDTGDTGVRSIAWSSTGTHLAIATFSSVRIWDVSSRKHMVQVQVPADSENGEIYVYNMAWSSDGQILAIAARQHLLLVDGRSGAIMHSFSANTALSPGSTAAQGPYLSARLPASGIAGFVSVAWSPDHRFLAVSLANGTAHLEVLHAQTGTLAFDLPISTFILPTELAWSPDSQYLASFSNAGYGPTVFQTNVQVWQVTTHRSVFEHAGLGAPDGTIAWLPGSLNLAFFVSHEHQAGLSVWDIARAQQIKFYAIPCHNPLVWLPDGRTFACVEQNNVRLVDATSGHTVFIHHGAEMVSALACSPDGMYLASADAGGTNGVPPGVKQPVSPGTVTVWVA